MATRLYLRTTGAGEPVPNVKQSTTTITHWMTITPGGLDDGTTIYPLQMLTQVGTGWDVGQPSYVEPGATHYGWVKAWVSPALAAQTISGTFTFDADFQEGSVSQNMMPRLYIYVWKGDDSGIRGVLFANGNSATEANVTIATLQTFFSNSLSSVVCSAGDRVVVEVMWFDNNTKTLEYVHGFSYNGAVASGSESYLELSADLQWYEAIVAKAVNDGARVGDAVVRKRVVKRLADGSRATDRLFKRFNKRLGPSWFYALWDALVWYSDGYHATGADLLDCARNGTTYKCSLTNASVGDTSDGPYYARDSAWKSTMFDAVSGDYGVIDGSSGAVFDLTAALTVFAWVKMKSAGQTNVAILSKTNDDTTTPWKMGVWGAGNVPNFGVNLHVPGPTVDWTSALDTTNWHLVVGVYSKSEGKVKISVDGGTFVTADYSVDLATGEPIQVARNNIFGGNCDMYLGPFGILSRALSQGEVAQLYQSYWGFGNLDADKPYGAAGVSATMSAARKTVVKALYDGVRVAATAIRGVSQWVRKFTEGTSVGAVCSCCVAKILKEGARVAATFTRGAAIWARQLNDGVRAGATVLKSHVRRLAEGSRVGAAASSFSSFVKRLTEGLRVGAAGTATIVSGVVAKAVSEGIRVAATVLVKSAFVRRLYDGARVDATSKRLTTFVKSLFDGVRVGATFTRGVSSWARTLYDGSRVDATGAKRFTKRLNDGTRASATARSLSTFVKRLFDGARVGATVRWFESHVRFVAEGARVSATVSFVRHMARALSDGVKVAATAAWRSTFVRILSEGASVAATFTRGASIWGRALYDGARVAAVSTRASTTVRALADGARVSATAAKSLIKALSEGAVAGATSLKSHVRRLAEGAWVAAESFRTVSGLVVKQLYDGVEVAATAITRSTFVRALTEGIRVGADVLSTLVGAVSKAVSEGIEVLATAVTRTDYIRSLQEGARTGASLAKSFTRRLADGLRAGAEFVGSTLDHYRRLADGVSAGAVATTITSYVRTVVEGLQAGATALTRTSYMRTLVEGARVAATALGISAIVRALSDGVSVLATSVRRSSFVRTLSEGVRAGAAAGTVMSFARRLQEGASVLATASSALISGMYITLVEGVRAAAEVVRVRMDYVRSLAEGALVEAFAIQPGRLLAQALTEGARVVASLVKHFYKRLVPVWYYDLISCARWASDGREFASIPGVTNTLENLVRRGKGEYAWFLGGGSEKFTAGRFGTDCRRYEPGDHDYCELRDTSYHFDWTDAISILVWVKPSGTTGLCTQAATIVAKNEDDTTIPWVIGIDSGKPYFYVNFHAGLNGITSPSQIQNGVWSQIVGTYSKSKGLIALYVNDPAGPLPGGKWTAAYSGTIASSADDVQIARKNIYGQYFDGGIEDLVFFTKDIHENDAAALYKSNKSLTWFVDVWQKIYYLDGKQHPSGGGILAGSSWRWPNPFKRLVQGIRVSESARTSITVILTVVPMAGSYPRPSRAATLSTRVLDDAGVARSGATVSAVVHRPDGTVWKNLTLTESAYVAGLYSSSFVISGVDPLGAYPLTISVSFAGRTATYDGFIIVYAGTATVVYFP